MSKSQDRIAQKPSTFPKPPDYWSVALFKRVAILNYGDALSSSDRSEHGKVPVFGSNGQVGRHNAANTTAPVIVVGRKGSHGKLVWSDEAGFAIDTAYFIDQRYTVSDLRWLYWTLHTLQLDAVSQDTGVPGLSRSDVHQKEIVIPPLPEQRAIAGFLDRETAKIDGLVEEQRRLIALLKEKRQAVISHAVTKGLNPTAPMKPSGIDWLGDIPAHWEVSKLGRATEKYCDGPFGSAIKTEHYVPDGTRVIRLQNIKAYGFDSKDAAYIDSEYFLEELSDKAVESHDLLIAGLGDEKNLVGRACVAPTGLGLAMVKADCFRFRLLETVSPKFVAFLMSSTASVDAALLGGGSTRTRIPLTKMARRHLLLPPLSEQLEIVKTLEHQLDGFNSLIAEATRAITLLQERRAALISAAVTGKIDVRDMAQDSAHDTEAA